MTTRDEPDKGIKGQERKKTPKKWKGHEDPRKQKDAGKYPNQFVFHSRAGNSWVVDDTAGHESMTFQHRGGSAMQFLPNGAIQLVAHNSLYHMVFGENRLTITGANDLTVKGDGSMLVYGDFNKTVHGNYNITATGDLNFTGENLNRMVRGDISTQAKNETKKLEGSSATTAQGAIAMASKDSLTAVSHSDQVHIGGGAGLNMFANEGNITGNIEKGNFHFSAKDGTFEAKIKDAIKFLSDSGALHLIAQEAANILAKNGDIKLNSQSGDIHVKADSGSYHNDVGGTINLQGGSSQQAQAQNASKQQGTSRSATQTAAVIPDDTSNLA